MKTLFTVVFLLVLSSMNSNAQQRNVDYTNPQLTLFKGEITTPDGGFGFDYYDLTKFNYTTEKYKEQDSYTVYISLTIDQDLKDNETFGFIMFHNGVDVEAFAFCNSNKKNISRSFLPVRFKNNMSLILQSGDMLNEPIKKGTYYLKLFVKEDPSPEDGLLIRAGIMNKTYYTGLKDSFALGYRLGNIK